MNLVIIDTNCANLTSVKFAIERLGINPIISDNAHTILSADKLILPGVGTADFAMNEIKNKNLIEVIRQVKKPLLGICLGMQLLGSDSEEGKDNKIQTLNIINTPTQKLNTHLPLPHMGWNQLSILDKNHPLFYGIDEGEFVYFVHSYRMPVGDNTLATCEYGEKFSAIIGKDNFFGMQFHPEKSGKVGEKLLKNFVENI